MTEEQEEDKKWLFYYKALAYEKQGDLEAVIHFLNKSVEVDPNFVLAWGCLGMVYDLTNNQPKREESFQKIIAISNESLIDNPNDVHTLYHKGLAYFELDKFPQALESIEKALELNPTYQLALKLNGELLIELKQFKKSIESFEKLDPNELDSKTLYWMGFTCRKLKKYQKAIGYYEAAIHLDPAHIDAWIELAEVYSKLNKKQEVSRCFEGVIAAGNHLIESNSETFLTWHQMGWAYKKLNQFSKAIKYFKKSVEIKPSFSWSWEEMGDIYVFLDKPQKAVECYEKVVELDPTDQKSLFLAGNLHFWLRNYERAIVHLEQLTENDTKNAILWRNLGMAHYYLENYERALRYLEKAIILDPQDYFPWGPMGTAYEYLGHSQKANECFKKMIKICREQLKTEPENEQLWFHMGRAYDNLTQHLKAIDCYKKAVNINPDFEDAWYYIAMSPLEKISLDNSPN